MITTTIEMVIRIMIKETYLPQLSLLKLLLSLLKPLFLCMNRRVEFEKYFLPWPKAATLFEAILRLRDALNPPLAIKSKKVFPRLATVVTPLYGQCWTFCMLYGQYWTFCILFFICVFLIMKV